MTYVDDTAIFVYMMISILFTSEVGPVDRVLVGEGDLAELFGVDVPSHLQVPVE